MLSEIAYILHEWGGWNDSAARSAMHFYLARDLLRGIHFSYRENAHRAFHSYEVARAEMWVHACDRRRRAKRRRHTPLRCVKWARYIVPAESAALDLIILSRFCVDIYVVSMRGSSRQEIKWTRPSSRVADRPTTFANPLFLHRRDFRPS